MAPANSGATGGSPRPPWAVIPSPTVPVYPGEKRGRWMIRVYWRGKPKTRRFRGTKREAEQAEAAFRLELEAADRLGREQSLDAPTFSAYSLGPYKEHAMPRLAPATWRNRTYQIATLIEHVGDLRLDEISTADIERYQTERMAQGIKASSVNDDTKVLRRILQVAVDRGDLAAIPKIERLKERKTTGRVMVWTAAQVDTLVATIREKYPEILGLVMVMLNAGLRKGEALALRWGCVDERKRVLKIHPSTEWRPKSGEPREVPISDALLPVLDRAREARRGAYVFPASTGTRYAYWPQRRFDAARRAAGIGGSPHVCRHTYASHFLAATGDMFLLARILGHSHQRVTELYSHLLPDYLERARHAVNFHASAERPRWPGFLMRF